LDEAIHRTVGSNSNRAPTITPWVKMERKRKKKKKIAIGAKSKGGRESAGR
jgi:hypothetical protein